MSKISIKKDFADGEKLFAVQLNNNFKVIEEGVNANEENLQEVIDQAITELDNELEEITANRGWDWNGGDRVKFYKGTSSQIENKEIENGTLLYNTETGETALDSDNNRITTGSGNVIVVSDEEPTNEATKVWINPDEIGQQKDSAVIDSLAGNETTKAPSVRAVKEKTNTIGDLDDLNTTDKSNLVNAINEVSNSSNYIVVGIESAQSLPSNTEVKLNLSKIINSNGNLLTLDANSNGVVIGTGVHNVEVSAQYYVYNYTGNGGRNIYIFNNDTLVDRGVLFIQNNYQTVGVSSIAIPVEEGDIITLKANSQGGTAEISVNDNITYLYVKVID